MISSGSIGHGWVVLIPFAVVMALRALGPRRRRGQVGGGGTVGTRSPLVGPSAPAPGVSAPGAPGATGQRPDAAGAGRAGADIGSLGIAPGWLADPSGRHEQRYWSGREWTDHVTDAGVPGIDPAPGRGGANGAR